MCRCCGTHLANTKEMNSISLLHSVPIRGTNSRVHFLVGDRVRAFSKDTNNLLRSLNARLSCQTDEIESKIGRMEIQLRDLMRRDKSFVSEIACYEAKRVLADLDKSKKSLVYRADGGLDYFSAISNEVGKLSPGSGVIVMASGSGKAGGPCLFSEMMQTRWPLRSRMQLSQMSRVVERVQDGRAKSVHGKRVRLKLWPTLLKTCRIRTVASKLTVTNNNWKCSSNRISKKQDISTI